MKALSITLRIVALAAAGFCIYAWVDTRQKVSYAVATMSGVEGETLKDKADAIPGILDLSAKRQKKADALAVTVSELENSKTALSSELEGERGKNLRASSELATKTSEIRALTQTVSNNKKSIADKDEMIEALKSEILKAKSMVTQNNEVDSLKEKVASLETQLEAKQKAFLQADKKAKILDMSEIVEVIETNAEGQKVLKKTVKVPYIPSGDIATVLSVDKDNMLVEINRGHQSGVKLDQKIVLRRDGEDVSEIKIAEVSADKSVGMVNRFVAIPETIEVGDSLELCNPVIDELVKKSADGEKPAEGAAPSSDDASAPAAPAAEAATVPTSA